MNAILNYVLSMLPYMIAASPIYLLARVIFVKVKQKKANRYHEAALFFLAVFAVGLASQTVLPSFEINANGFHLIQKGVHKTNIIPLTVLFETYREVFVNGNIHYFLINFLGNLVMFLPFGFLVPLLWNLSGKKTLLIGFFCSLFIECCQLFLARGTDVDDLILNTAGTALGLLLYRYFENKCISVLEKFKN
jgi:glycopeptide antibiotics resistance protein